MANSLSPLLSALDMSSTKDQTSTHTEIDDRGVDFDLIDEEFARYRRLNQAEIETDGPPAPSPERVPTPDSLRHRLDTMYLTREDMKRLNLPDDYPILSDAERTKLRTLKFADDFRRRLQSLDETISEHRRILESCPIGNSRRPMVLHALALGLFERYFDLLCDHADLSESVERAREALDLCPEGDPCRPHMLSNLSQCLWRQYHVSENPADLDESVNLGEESLDVIYAGPLCSEVASGLAFTYTNRCFHPQSRQDDDLDRAFQLSWMAVEAAPISDTSRCIPLLSLSYCHYRKFIDARDAQDLNQAVQLSEEAVNIGPPCENRRWFLHHLLGFYLEQRFRHSSDLEDLRQTTRTIQKALALSPLQAAPRGTLVLCLTHQYSVFLQHDDFEAAAAHALHSLQDRSLPISSRRNFLDQSGYLFAIKHHNYRTLPDLNRALAYLRSTIWFHNPNTMQYIANLGTLCGSLCVRFMATGNKKDLEEALDLEHRILELLPDEIHGRAVIDHFSQLAAARYRQTRESEAFDQVLHWYRCADTSIARNEQDMMWIPSITLAASYVIRFQDSKDTGHLLEARRLYHAAIDASSNSPANTFMTIFEWISEMNSFKLPEEAFYAYTDAIQLLPRIVYMGHDQHSRLQVLARSSTISADSAACAVGLGRISEAVELLEAGRAVFWSQVLRSRTQFDVLPTELSSRLLDITHRLDSGSISGQETASYSVHGEGSAGSDLFDRQRLNEEFDLLLAQARLLPGFEHFLKPKSFASLAEVAKFGPVVVLVASALYGCGAIIIKPGGTVPEHVASTGMTVELLQHHVGVLSRAARAAREGLRHLKPKDKDEKPSSREGYGSVLAALWTIVVKPIIDALELKKSADSSRPRVWWCPTGPFTFLPIHATGIYGDVTECTSDYMISSYTPTLNALIISRGCTPVIKNVLLVAEPFAPHQSQLPETAFEIDEIVKLLPPEVPCVLKGNVSSIADSNVATVDWTAKVLPDFSVVHLACHGHQDQRNPLRSGFYLRDGSLSLERLMKIKLPNAFFAFLSACESASGDRERPDETIHLAAAMLFAGYRSIIATMWTMDDTDGPKVAHEVYKELFKTYPVINPDAIPRALDSAVRKLRAHGVPPSRWATYIHMGC